MKNDLSNQVHIRISNELKSELKHFSSEEIREALENLVLRKKGEFFSCFLCEKNKDIQDLVIYNSPIISSETNKERKKVIDFTEKEEMIVVNRSV